MPSWRNATGAPDAGRSAPGLTRDLWRAVIRPERLSHAVVREVLPPTPALEPWVEQVWSLAWSQPVPASLSSLISHPAMHLTLEAGPEGEVRHGHTLPAALLHGVTRTRFAVDLPAHGWVVGLHLVPGAFHDLTGVAASTLTDRVVLWDPAWPDWELGDVWAAEGPRARALALRAEAERMLGGRSTTPEGRAARAVERLVREDRSLRSVEDLAARRVTSVRSLQRLCRDHLGVSPLWLLRRARVLDAHELLTTTDRDVAEIAADLGWYDQAHFTRDYTAVTGVPPVRFRRELGDPTTGPDTSGA